MILQFKKWDGAPHCLVTHVHLLMGLTQLVHCVLLLVDPLKVMDHPPIVVLGAASLPPGDGLIAESAESNVLSALLAGKISPKATGLVPLHC